MLHNIIAYQLHSDNLLGDSMMKQARCLLWHCRRIRVGVIFIVALLVLSMDVTLAIADTNADETYEALEELDSEMPCYFFPSSRANNYLGIANKTARCRQELIDAGCLDINVDACTAWLYAFYESDGFSDHNYVYKEKSVLRNYITKEQIIEFGRTGEGLNVVYFKDEDGNETPEPALLFVANPDVKVAKFSYLQEALDWWEERAPGFLRALVANDVRVIFQSQAGGSWSIQHAKYGDGIVYMNYSYSPGGLRIFWPDALAVEQFGIRAIALGMGNNESGLIKSRFAELCDKYIALVKNADTCVYSMGEKQNYITGYYYELYSVGWPNNEIEAFVDYLKDNNLVTPFGADSWQDIDDALAIVEQYDSGFENSKIEDTYFCSRLLNMISQGYPVFTSPSGKIYTVPADILSSESVIKYGETGKGLSVISRANQPFKLNHVSIPSKPTPSELPAIALVNVSADVGKQLKAAVKHLENQNAQAVNMLYDLGLLAIVQEKVDIAGGYWLSYSDGVMLINCDEADEKELGSTGLFYEFTRMLGKLIELPVVFVAGSVDIINEDNDVRNSETLVIDLASDTIALQLFANVIPVEASQSVTWRSSDKSIATVSEDGLVLGLKSGTVTIIATATDGTGVKAACRVAVANLAKEITITGDDTVVSGKRITLKAEVLPTVTTNKKMSWESSDPDIATVSVKGVVSAKQVDETKTVTITATAQDGSGVAAEWVVTVTPVE